mmetsp:Transcript_18791/g.51454  ORF Transcript_18791/g.51454 Transcript_18791/m.51454 type:complete len:97 (+) Transcript_18791:2753-3043(+)|eukprot:CAMPEP_0168795570 /NCGR_PEP_ID=MMETSP0725-20121227/16268_1 /TAXON_ID=265536 /ORGANISM="Amphiprora sp., Strain CCMP467" /LENGTH=96 /DNA_ID=CAMNT_0008846579 /DNA_START=276 /DNA_END=566 /DNA_ORIENTATION=+
MDGDIIGLSEINLDTTNFTVNEQLRNASRNIFDYSQLTAGSSSIPAKHNFKPGGTLLLSQGAMSARVQDAGHDALGRWTYQTFGGKRGKKITIICT